MSILGQLLLNDYFLLSIVLFADCLASTEFLPNNSLIPQMLLRMLFQVLYLLICSHYLLVLLSQESLLKSKKLLFLLQHLKLFVSGFLVRAR